MEVTYRLWPFWTSSADQRKLTNALSLAIRHHAGQFRKYDGEPYIVHPMRVAMAVSSYPLIKLTDVQAAILHDTKEDTAITDEEIIKATSEEVLFLVNELTNQTKALKGVPRRDRKKLDWERLSKASREAKLIKMFDRSDNLRDMVNAPTDFKKLYIEETYELLKYVGDADWHIANQVKTACEAFFSWRQFTISELLGKSVGVEVEHGKYGLGVMAIEEIEGQQVKVINFDKSKHGDIKIRIDQSEEIDWKLFKETGIVRRPK